MGYAPFARWRNFTLDNLKSMLELYPDLYNKTQRETVVDKLETQLKGYKRTAYQWACQLGIDTKTDNFTTQNYLYCFNDDGLKMYLAFWFKMYVSPNPYVQSDDSPICIFAEIAHKLIDSPTHSILFTEFCNDTFGGSNGMDIFKNALISYGKPILVRDDSIYIEEHDLPKLEEILVKVENTLPMINNKDIVEFFNRFSCSAFMSFYNLNKIDEYVDIEKIIKKEPTDNLSFDMLAAELKKMYDAPKGSGKVAAIHMFAIKYAEQILENGYKNKDLAIAAGINESYDVEINKGLSIYKSIKENEYNIHFYSENNSDLSEAEKEVFDFNSLSGSAINKIFFGVPGCGKSYHIEHNILGKDKNSKKYIGKYKKENIVRTTFYQDYSNTDFVGQILPKITKDENGEDNVEYIFNPGPFTLALIQAIKAKNANTETFMPTNNKVALVIEEVNRGNAPAIFGDIFQLLDRDEDGISEYGIVNVGVIDYLNSFNFGTEENPVYYKFDEIKIPGNMDIFATMNTSDQNVYTLDTAFTRRWEKERIANKFDANSEIAKYYVPGITGCTWEEFVNKINHKIQTSLDDLQVNEDKQLGCFFVRKRDLIEKYTDAKAVSEESKRAFAYKVLQYLWDDVTKLEHSVIFSHNYKTFDELVDAYIAGGAVIFNDTISFDIETPKENSNGQ